ncbi:hypothetical protein [Aurantiacibacter gangjinensis]|uniref:hypothetical protein n=1 Tax=Aurantiacibacter gangjinensis TaxID=502682 RepID=UPI00069C0D95|nr:hypothetical protein [Aurantiacibacter gangjinensis]APE27628.1 hypothetical protein BMF35_a0799 [Aurantiacibacter gangjinensis]
MQGQVLGFASDEGAITGDNGERYKFTRADWKADRDPRPGEKVDFVAGDANTAGEIYPLARGAGGPDLGAALQSGSDSLSRLAQGDGAQNIIARAKAAPGMVIASLVLFTCLLLPYVTIDINGEGGSTSLLGYIFGGTAEWRDIAEFARNRAENAWLMTEGDRNTLRGVAGDFDIVATLAWTLLIVPVAAGWTIFRYLKEQSTRRSEILTVVGIVWAIIYFLGTKGMLMSAMERLTTFGSSDSIREGFTLGFGGYILVLLAVATIAARRGMFGKKQEQVVGDPAE